MCESNTDLVRIIERLRALFDRMAADRGAWWDSDGPALLKAADAIERLMVALQQTVDRYPDHEDMLDIARNALQWRQQDDAIQ